MTKILVMAPNWVGDAIMATPAVAFLRASFPDAGIIVVGREYVGGVFADNPHVSGVVPLTAKKPDAETMAGLRACQFDAVAVMPNSLRAAWTAYRIGVPHRVGYARHMRRLVLTDSVPYDPYEWQTPVDEVIGRAALQKRDLGKPGPWNRPPRHMVHYYMRVAARTAEALGTKVELPSGGPGSPPLVLPVNPEARRQVEAMVEQRGLAGKLIVGVGCGAANGAAKLWPPEKFAKVLDRLAWELGSVTVSLGGPRERAMTDRLAAAMNSPLVRLGEELSVSGVTALIDRLSLALVVDSGAMHIAAARGTPVVAVFGPTDWNVTAPWSARAEVVRESPACAPCLLKQCPIDHRCMQDLQPDTVFEAAMRLLAKPATTETRFAG